MKSEYKNGIKAAVCAGVMAAMGAGAAQAVDYSGLNGKSGASLKQAVKALAGGHTVISYGDKTWGAFETTDVREYMGQEIWYDMYSNKLVPVSSGHSSLNIEHSVANSWWGGLKNDAYKDIHHLNPSNANANNAKSNHPLGTVAGTPTFYNGVTKIGAPRNGEGGGSELVFEPADQYKGDFARAYFYVFTIYDDIAWQGEPACMYDLSSYPTLQPWAYEMLLQWAAEDPVDEKEAARNAAVAAVQGNENPYISIPGLAEYVWGSKRNVAFNLTAAMTAPVANRPDAPQFGGDFTLADVDTWSGRWWDSFSLTLDSDAEAVYYAVNGGDYKRYTGAIAVPQAKSQGETYTVSAYAANTLSGQPYAGAVSTLTLTAYDSDVEDYMHAKWEIVEDAGDVTDGLYIAVASTAKNVMGSTAGGTYLNPAGAVTVSGGMVEKLPEGAAVLRLEEEESGHFSVEVCDLVLKSQGYLAPTAVKSLKLAQTPVLATIKQIKAGSASHLTFDFGTDSNGTAYGWLQYNASSPRFCVYTSNQQAIDLYRFVSNAQVGTGMTGMPEVTVETIYTPGGMQVGNDLERLPAGVYIVVSSEGVRKVLKK